MYKDNHLIVLMGTTGTGKSDVAKEFEDRGYTRVSLDDIIAEKYGRRNDELTEPEIEAAYTELSRRAIEALDGSNVVVDEWFYQDGTLDILTSPLDPHVPVYYFNLNGDLSILLGRVPEDADKDRKEYIEKHHAMTIGSPSRYVKEWPVVDLDVNSRTPRDVEWAISTYVAHQLKSLRERTSRSFDHEHPH